MELYQSYKQMDKTIYSLYADKNDSLPNIDSDNFDGLFNTNFTSNDFLKKDYIVNIKQNFDMIVGDVELIELQINQKSGVENILVNYIETNKLKNKYDYILIDCPPTYSFYFISSYLASDTYLIPLKPDFVSSIGLALLQRATKQIVKSFNQEISSLGIIYTLIDPRNTIHRNVIADIENNMDKKYIFSTTVRYLKAIPDGVNTGLFMADIPDQGICKDIMKITEEFITRMEQLK